MSATRPGRASWPARSATAIRNRSLRWLSDLRGFTDLADRTPAPALIELLNRYFDCQVPAILAQGSIHAVIAGDDAFPRRRYIVSSGAGLFALARSVGTLGEVLPCEAERVVRRAFLGASIDAPAPRAAAPPSEGGDAHSPSSAATVRVRVERIDGLLDGLAGLLHAKSELDEAISSSPPADRMRRTALIAGAVVAGMTGMAFAAVPLYDAFCKVTGYGGTTQEAQAAPAQILEQRIEVRFDANTAPDMPWEFRPKQRSITLRLGETGLAFYEARNPTDRPVAGQATFNVVPFQAGGYFDKIACFCFELQVLGPGERVEMPVSFFVDPALLDDRETEAVDRITLSYTMYPAELPEDTASAAPETTTELAAAPAVRATIKR